jgi:hypothetical protein
MSVRVRASVGVGVGMLGFVFVVVDAIELKDCVGGGRGARDPGQRADGAGV